MSTVEKKPYIHLSIDDTFEIFNDLAQNAMYYSSIASQKKGILAYRMYRTFFALTSQKVQIGSNGDFMAAARIPDTNMLPGGKRKKIILLLSENCCVSQGLSVVLMLLHGCIFLPELGNASGRCANQTTG